MPQRTFLGIVAGTRRGAWAPLRMRLEGAYVLGVTGSGKSTYLLGLMCQDLADGRGLCLLDPNGDLVTDLIARAKGLGREGDLLLLDLQATEVAFGLNVFACRDPGDPQAVAQTSERVVGLFKKIWGDSSWGPRMEDLLANAVVTLVANPGATLADLPRLLTDQAYRTRLVARVQSRDVKQYWASEYDLMRPGQQQQVYGPITNKVRKFLRDEFVRQIVEQTESSVDFAAAIRERKVVLVRLDPGMEETTDLLGGMVLQQLLEAAFSRRDLAVEEREPFMIYADEVHRFANPTLVTILREARKYGIATTAATQMHSLLPSDVATAFTNSAILVCFQLIPKDVAAIAPLFRASVVPGRPVFEPDPFGRILRFGHADPEVVRRAQLIYRAVGRGESWWRDARRGVEHYLYAVMAGRLKPEQQPAESWAVWLSEEQRAAVWWLARRLARDPLLREGEGAPSVGEFLVNEIPAHHALVRFRDGARVTHCYVRTLPTRPLGEPANVRPLGIPRQATPASDQLFFDERDETPASNQDGPPPI